MPAGLVTAGSKTRKEKNRKQAFFTGSTAKRCTI